MRLLHGPEVDVAYLSGESHPIAENEVYRRMKGESAGDIEIGVDMQRAYALVDWPAAEGGGSHLDGEPFLVAVDGLVGYLKDTQHPESAHKAAQSYVSVFAPAHWLYETGLTAAGISLARHGWPEVAEDIAHSEGVIERIHQAAVLGAAAFGFRRMGDDDRVSNIVEYLGFLGGEDLGDLVEALES